MIRNRWRDGLALLAAGLAIAWGSAWFVRESGYASAVDRARAEARSGRFAEARRSLAALPPARLAADPEAADLLATAEHAAGHYDRALAAWALIPEGWPRWPSTALARARTLAGDLGRFEEAGAILESLLPRAGPLRLDVRHTLQQLCFLEGRPEAMRRLIREGWRDWRDPASELRDLWLIDDATVMVDEVRATLDRARSRAPDDERVGLGLAALAALAGRFEEARALLGACQARRPDDPAPRVARLRLARASGDAEGARAELGRIAAGSIPESELLDLAAWLAGRRGDAAGARRALELRVAVEPADPRALEGLAVLAWEAGDRDRAADLRRKKAALDAAKDRYRRLLVDLAPTGNFPELAGLAEALDRPFEALGWWTLARGASPGDPAALAALDRLKGHRDEVEPATSGTLADRLAGLLPGLDATSLAASPAGPAPGQARFADEAEAAGLRFTLEVGRSAARQMPETTAGGVGVLDYDGDGWLDVYAIQAGAFPPDPSRPHGGDRLFRNKGDGTFEDASERSGIAAMPRGFGHGVAVGDVDNDGRPDLLVTRWRAYALYHNKGDGTFEDVTESWGLGGDRGWPTSAALADLDGDGDLDLYVAHYIDWDERNPTLCARATASGPRVDPDRKYDYCMPRGLVASADHLFRNDGGRFVDATAEAGIVDRDGRGLGILAADLDDDGKIDLFVANDTTANYLFRNKGGLRFEESGDLAGVASNAEGAYQAGMGTALGDLDGDGRPDLAVTNFYGEATTLYRNLGGGTYSDRTVASGLAAASRYRLGFGLAFLDADNDGRLDLATANGHVNDDRPRFPYAMPAQLVLGIGKGRVADASATAGECWSAPRIGRGLAVADLDNDGRPDLLIVSQDGPLAYFRNRSEGPGRSATFRLEGGPASGRDAVGARVTVLAGGRRQVAVRFGGGSFQSASDPRVRVGLGPVDWIDEVEVRWPSGRVDRHAGLPAGAGHLLREADPAAAPLPGFEGRR